MKLTQVIGTDRDHRRHDVTSSALLLLATTSIDDGYGRLAIVLALLGAGMGLILSPATHSVMSSLPAGEGRGRISSRTTPSARSAVPWASPCSAASCHPHTRTDFRQRSEEIPCPTKRPKGLVRP